ncbi:uncharacterized protein LOC143292691 [Babylonia areolata]|uniref:uncharacterized protein LOC143292691 n=1 Tax=Babylonia areolata TaxID=304850 RepID=UPI003FD3C86B
MTSRQDTGTSPLVPPLVEEQTPCRPEEEEEEDHHHQPEHHHQHQHQTTPDLLPEEHQLLSTEELPGHGTFSSSSSSSYPPLLSYTPSSTPVRPYRFSEHIHKDRHIFLKGASLGIGCGSPSASSPLSFPRSAPEVGWLGSAAAAAPWNVRCFEQGQGQGDIFVDELGRVFSIGGRYLGMAVGGDGFDDNDNDDHQRLPTVHRVQLALPSAVAVSGSGSRHGGHGDRFPHVHPHHQHQHQQPPSVRRRFNEQLNTYVDTRKRIRTVQSLDDLYRRSSSTSPTASSSVFPYLSTPSPRRPRPPPPPPAKIRTPLSRVPPPSLSLPLSNQLPQKGAGRAGERGAVFDSPVNNHHHSNNVNMTAHGAHQDPDLELTRARHVMQELQQVSSNQNYADYFLAKEGRQGTLGRLFEGYPKRVLVHPGRLLRQRTDIVSRAKLSLLK